VQFTDRHGLASFRSIYPGHYQGRTTHIHIKVHTGATDSKGKLTGGHVAHTGNLFPTDAVSTAVYKLRPTTPTPPSPSPRSATSSPPASTDRPPR
jgi:protocatechuate 3,4-dioxygenase beta subunit